MSYQVKVIDSREYGEARKRRYKCLDCGGRFNTFERIEGSECMEKGYSIIQTAELTGMKARTVREWIRTGKIHAVKAERSGRWVIPEREVSRLMKK